MQITNSSIKKSILRLPTARAARLWFPAAAVVALSILASGGPSFGAQPNTVVLDEVVVTATRTERKLDETPGTVTAIDFESFGPVNFAEVIKDQPLVSAPFTASGTGVTAYQRSGYNSYNIRGIEGNRVLQQIDGIRVPDQFSLGGSEVIGRDYLDPEVFKRVEILHGSASAPGFFLTATQSSMPRSCKVPCT